MDFPPKPLTLPPLAGLSLPHLLPPAHKQLHNAASQKWMWSGRGKESEVKTVGWCQCGHRSTSQSHSLHQSKVRQITQQNKQRCRSGVRAQIRSCLCLCICIFFFFFVFVGFLCVCFFFFVFIFWWVFEMTPGFGRGGYVWQLQQTRSRSRRFEIRTSLTHSGWRVEPFQEVHPPTCTFYRKKYPKTPEFGGLLSISILLFH